VRAPGYTELVRELFPRLTGGIRWGTDRTARLLAAVGDPHRSLRTIHVGGTNGKGSVAATLASVLRADGRSCGLYTSPHLCSFRERIQLDGVPIAEDALVRAADRLWPSIQREEPSFFEATTAIAFLAMAEAAIEVAVVEVGLGGRLDATNVIDPMVVALTNVAMDHVEFLGDTVVSIAGEKAGIIKRGVPVVTAETRPDILGIFRERAAGLGAPFRALGTDEPTGIDVDLDGTRFELDTRHWDRLELRVPLIGIHQARNAALAVRALEELPAAFLPARDAVVKGVAGTRWPGRIQRERVGERLWVLDVAHNPAGVATLAEALRSLPLPRPLVALIGILGDKDWQAMLPPILALTDAAVLTIALTAPTHRLWDPMIAAAGSGPHVSVKLDFGEAIAEAQRLAAGGTVLVTGSFHTVGDAMAALGMAPWGIVDAGVEIRRAALPGATMEV